jgi:hypothetical protein
MTRDMRASSRVRVAVAGIEDADRPVGLVLPRARGCGGVRRSGMSPAIRLDP